MSRRPRLKGQLSLTSSVTVERIETGRHHFTDVYALTGPLHLTILVPSGGDAGERREESHAPDQSKKLGGDGVDDELPF